MLSFVSPLPLQQEFVSVYVKGDFVKK